ncbi:MAG TPA: hypothetical protein VLA56_17430 [Pseudomonadales bacterium]|nr:hypothetical protein [Pseudomonadales bacterium]
MRAGVATRQQRLTAVAVVVLLALILGAGTVAVIEARREVRILCAMMQPGRSLASVEDMLATIEWSAWSRESTAAGTLIHLASPWDLGLMRCEIRLAEDVVLSARLGA